MVDLGGLAGIDAERTVPDRVLREPEEGVGVVVEQEMVPDAALGEELLAEEGGARGLDLGNRRGSGAGEGADFHRIVIGGETGRFVERGGILRHGYRGEVC